MARTLLLWLCGVVSGLAATPLGAAELSKCLDRDGHVTYSSARCEAQGLKSAGPIRDRTTVMPAPVARRDVAKDPGGKAAAARDAKDPGGELRGSPVQIKPINPLIEKLVK